MLQTRVPPSFTAENIRRALQDTKADTAPGYDFVHLEYLTNLGPEHRRVSHNSSPESYMKIVTKIWRKAKVIGIEKPGKDPKLPAKY